AEPEQGYCLPDVSATIPVNVIAPGDVGVIIVVRVTFGVTKPMLYTDGTACILNHAALDEVYESVLLSPMLIVVGLRLKEQVGGGGGGGGGWADTFLHCFSTRSG
ncbi:MAG: hypothetical protein MN733_31750, partial [Nitrososphaera sp.]|nr:hypothetical protein [Nitrososphaera sp.]